MPADVLLQAILTSVLFPFDFSSYISVALVIKFFFLTIYYYFLLTRDPR